MPVRRGDRPAAPPHGPARGHGRQREQAARQRSRPGRDTASPLRITGRDRCPTASTNGILTSADSASMPRTALEARASASALAASSHVAAAGGSRSASGLAARAASAGTRAGGRRRRAPQPPLSRSGPSRSGSAEHPAQELLVAVGERGDEPGEHRLAVRLLVQDAGHPAGGEPGRVGDRRVQVGAARLVPVKHALGVQPGEDRHHRGVGEVAADQLPDLAGRQRGPAALQYLEDRGLQLAGAAPAGPAAPRRRGQCRRGQLHRASAAIRLLPSAIIYESVEIVARRQCVSTVAPAGI